MVEIKAGATLGTDQFKGLRYYRKLAAALPMEQDYYLVYGGEERQNRAHGMVLGWQEFGELSYEKEVNHNHDKGHLGIAG